MTLENSPEIAATEAPESTPDDTKGSYFGEVIRFTIIVAVILLPIRIFIAKPFIVSGSSMDPTFASGQYLVIDELSYHFRAPARGEVVVFKYPLDTSKYFIKRVVGLPGETVNISGSTIQITAVNGKAFTLKEPYVAFPSQNVLIARLKTGEYFVMGDNRAASSDSRSWGPVPKEDIVGNVFVRLFPVSLAGLHPGDAKTLNPNF